jgi:hypothetical protein
MGNRQQPMRLRLAQAEKPHLLYRMTVIHFGNQQRVEEDFARFRE